MESLSGSVHVWTWPRFPLDRERTLEVVEWRDGLRARDLVPEDWLEHADQVMVHVNGLQVELEGLVDDGAVAHIGLMPADTFTDEVLLGLGKGTLEHGAGYLFGYRKPPKFRDSNASATYGFGGLANTRVEGQPVSCCYGRMRVAGQILNEFTTPVLIRGGTQYRVLISYGEGPVLQIGNQTEDTPTATPLEGSDLRGVYINGSAFENIPGAKAWVRTGTFEQEPIPGFEEVRTQETVDRDFEREDGTGLLVQPDAVADNTAATLQAWTDYALSYDLNSADFDGAAVVLEFPGGLYGINGSGEVTTQYAYFAVRYIELDSVGTPITTGGNWGDGYIYLPTYQVQTSLQGYFQKSLDFAYFDPQALGSTGLLSSARFNGTDAFAAKGSFNNPESMDGASGTYSIAGWVKPDTLHEGCIFEQRDSSTTRRWGLYTRIRPTGEMAFQIIDQVSGVSNTIGAINNAGEAPLNEFAAGEWVHFAMTRSADTAYADGDTTFSVAFYINGVLVETNPPEDKNAWHARDGSLRFGSAHGGSSWFDGNLAGWVLYSRVLTAHDVDQLVNSGFGTADPQTAGLVSHWLFNAYSGGQFADSVAAYPNDLSGGGSIGTGLGHILDYTFGDGSTSKRGKFRIEVLRLDKRSSSVRISDEARWSDAVGIVDQTFSYPGQAILALHMTANETLNQSVPEVEADISGRLVPVWNEESTEFPVFEPAWTDNPAWVAADILLNKTHGGGAYVSGQDLNLPQFKELALWAGEFISDNYPSTLERTSSGWVDMRWLQDSQLISVSLASAASVPAHWTRGSYVAFSSFVTGGGLLLDLNYDTGDLGKYGLKIQDIVDGTLFLEFPQFTQYGAPWPDGQTLTDAGVTPAGTMFGVEPRWAFNGVFDTATSVWDAVESVMSVAQATPVREGSRIGCAIDRARPVSAQVTPASTIIPSSEDGASSFAYGYTSKRRLPNRIEVDYLDSRDSFTQRTAVYSDPDIDNETAADNVVMQAMDGFGITSRAQAIRAAQHLVNKAKFARRQGSYATGLEGLYLQAGDVVVVSHDLIPRGDSGRVRSGITTTTLTLDAEVTLEAATTYKLQLRNPLTGAFETATVGSAAGTYAIGDTITVATGYTDTPVAGMEWLLYVEGSQLYGEVVGRSTDPNSLVSTVEWREYVPSIYTGIDTIDTDQITEQLALGNDGAPDGNAQTPPAPVVEVTIRDSVQTDADSGSASRRARVSWRQLESGREHIWVDHYNVWLRSREGASLSDPVGDWELVATTSNRHASFALPGRLGSGWEVAVQPVSTGGASSQPQDCARMAHVCAGRSILEPAVTDLDATLDGELVEYSWTLPDNRRDLRVEIRRGHPDYWALLPVVAISEPGASRITSSDWVSALDNAAGDYSSGPYLVARTVNSAGDYGEATSLAWQPDPTKATIRTNASSLFYQQAWEDYGDGWEVDTLPPAGDPVLTDLVRHADGYLEWTGSSLTGRYKTFESISPTFNVTPDRHHIEATVVAEQVYPQTIEDFPARWTVGGSELAQWTIEGPLATRGSEAGVGLQIQFRVTTSKDAAWGSWQDYKPGIVPLVAIQWRLQLTRPTTDYQIKIHSFRTRARRIAPQRWERNPTKYTLQQRFFRSQY